MKRHLNKKKMDSYSFKASLNNIKPLIITLKAIASNQVI